MNIKWPSAFVEDVAPIALNDWMRDGDVQSKNIPYQAKKNNSSVQYCKITSNQS